jgi:starch-binding outer membrane protein, SusD/RagB family
MKIIKIKYILAVMTVVFTMNSCSDEFLELKKEGSFLEEDYYKTEQEAFNGLIAAYSALRKNSGGFENTITMLNAGSDDHYAGGGSATDGAGIHAFSNYTIDTNNVPGSFWSVPYQGVFNANKLLEKIDPIPMDASKKARFVAESKALRAYYYFNLVVLFKNVPLILKPLTTVEINSVTQATPEAVYTQIEKDLTESIPVLPITVTGIESGRFSKGAATALLGKVYLYQKKYTQAATQLALVNGTPGTTSAYGYKLLTKFADLWKVDNKYNSESILEIGHSNKSQATFDIWGGSQAQGNLVCQMVGPRGYSRTTGSNADDIPSGWSFNPITQDLYDALKPDPRFARTVLDMKALVATGKVNKYIPGDQDTGYFLNKFIPRQSDVTSLPGNSELNYVQNTYAIRLADTYLMEAEALGGTGSRAQALLDAVRLRAGLTSIPVSIDAIMKERRLELAGEGFRWLDLVRTGKASAILGSRGFIAGKNEIFPIPFTELKNTKLVQSTEYK